MLRPLGEREWGEGERGEREGEEEEGEKERKCKRGRGKTNELKYCGREVTAHFKVLIT